MPSKLTILNLTFFLLLFTQIQLLILLIYLNSSPQLTLNSILDIHAPLKSKIVVLRPHTPWINPEILVAKRERSRLERSWRRWKSPVDGKKFRAQCNFVRSLISKAKSNFLTNLHWIILQPSHTVENFKFNSPPQPIQFIPWHTRHTITCQFIPAIFSDKIERIRSKFFPSDSPDPLLFPINPPPNLSNFNPTTFSEIRNLIFFFSKQCELDSIPTFLLKLCFDELGSTIINIINFSLYLKASFHLLSNKQSLILYSKNLLFLMMISTSFVLFLIWTLFPKFSRKLLPLVSSLTYCLTHLIFFIPISAYRMFHSTETTLLGDFFVRRC